MLVDRVWGEVFQLLKTGCFNDKNVEQDVEPI